MRQRWCGILTRSGCTSARVFVVFDGSPLGDFEKIGLSGPAAGPGPIIEIFPCRVPTKTSKTLSVVFVGSLSGDLKEIGGVHSVQRPFVMTTPLD
jgi:hypothetical protein